LKTFETKAANAARIAEKADEASLNAEAFDRNYRRCSRTFPETKHEVLSSCVNGGKERNLEIPEFYVASVSIVKDCENIVPRHGLKTECHNYGYYYERHGSCNCDQEKNPEAPGKRHLLIVGARLPAVPRKADRNQISSLQQQPSRSRQAESNHDPG